MCGFIAAGRGPHPTDVAAIELALDTIRHRGPDADGIKITDEAVLAHVRLSILDPTQASNQPFTWGDTTVVFNGEVWNYRELRSSLEQRGHRFHTTGDVEVLAAILDVFGEKGLPMIQGMFAVAWTKGGALRAARDRFGEVPLHVCRSRRMVASEVKALLAAGCPGADIAWVRPGTVVELASTPVVREWYRLSVLPTPPNREAAASAWRGLIRKGTQERTISDVPVCTLLSGGVDSSAIAAFARERIPDLIAYTAVFDSSSRDLAAARRVADHLGIELREVKIDPPTTSDLSEVVRTIELPYSGQTQMAWASLKLGETMRRDGFKVTLSGEGADELTAGYDFSKRGIRLRGWHDYRRWLFHQQHCRNFARSNKAFMASSVECRMPYLSTELVEFMFGLPQDFVQRGRRRKALMQEALRELLPARVLRRKKVMFYEGLRLDRAIDKTLNDAPRFYRAQFAEIFRGVDIRHEVKPAWEPVSSGRASIRA
jgi:asparagine synthase (glutamine-hydrolysing)